MAYVTSTLLVIGAAVSAAAGTAVSAVSAIQQSQAAAKQADAARDAYNQNVQIASQNAKTSQAAENQMEVQAEQKTVQDTSARLMRADQALGTLRVTTGATGTSQDSYNALMEQETYSEGSDLNTLQTQYGNTITSAEQSKAQDRVDYTNSVATAGTALESNIAKTNAASTSALLNGIGSGLSIGANYANGQIKEQASTDAFNQAITNLNSSRKAN